jgi:hypothetical protein
LATVGEGSLADSGDEVEVNLSNLSRACASSVESILTTVVLLAEVVDEIESIGLSGTSRILASSGYRSLAYSCLKIEVLAVGTAECGVEAAVALVVVSADVVDEVESIVEANTAGILAAIRYISLALAGLKIEILVAGACIEHIDSIGTPVVV